MKKLLIALLILCLAGIAIAALAMNGQPPEEAAAPIVEETAAPADGETAPVDEETAPADEETAPVDEETAPDGVDYAAIYALHDPDEVVMTVDGQEVTWSDYFYLYYNQATQLEDQFAMYQYYGYAMGWSSEADDEGHTYAELMGDGVEQNLRRLITIETLAEENGVQLIEEEEAAIQAEHQENIVSFCGEEGTEEQLFEALESIYLRPELYRRIIRISALSQAAYRQFYGENGELLEDQRVLDWMEENGIVSANHILIATVDLGTGEPLDEAAVAEKTALAQNIAEELQAIEDPAERGARFLELKEQVDEDGNAYVFGQGVMVDEFYNGTLALEEGEISDPVLSVYGYHVILRRPVHADDLVFTGYSEESARSLASADLFGREMQAKLDGQQVVYIDGFEAPNILDYKSKTLETQ